MKAVILAGGFGSRLSEETAVRPKPMVEIGGKPMLWHIMKIYAAHGIEDFVICLGYKGYLIKEYFANYYLHTCDVSFDLAGGSMEVHRSEAEPWRVTLVDTGEATMTGGRLQRVLPYVGDEDFCFTYGDGVADVDISRADRLPPRARTRAPQSPPCSRPGASARSTSTDDWCATSRRSRAATAAGPTAASSCSRPSVARHLDGDATVWEQEPMRQLAREGQLASYRHHGFWQAMDTLRDRNQLEQLWRSGEAPWRTWA